jgi:hypothetical protein
MFPQCCAGEGSSRRLARRFRGATASLLPGAVLMLLPKCPLCLAAWLAMATGIGVSATAASRIRAIIVILWAVGVALAASQFIRRRPQSLAGTLLSRKVSKHVSAKSYSRSTHLWQSLLVLTGRRN